MKCTRAFCDLFKHMYLLSNVNAEQGFSFYYKMDYYNTRWYPKINVLMILSLKKMDRFFHIYFCRQQVQQTTFRLIFKTYI